MGVSKNRCVFYPQNGWLVYNGSRPYEQMDVLGGNPYFWFNTHMGMSKQLFLVESSWFPQLTPFEAIYSWPFGRVSKKPSIKTTGSVE